MQRSDRRGRRGTDLAACGCSPRRAHFYPFRACGCSSPCALLPFPRVPTRHAHAPRHVTSHPLPTGYWRNAHAQHDGGRGTRGAPPGMASRRWRLPRQTQPRRAADRRHCGARSGHELVLRGCGLEGAIPVEIGNFGRLTELDLSDNRLVGPIPAEIGNLTRLKRLYLNGNRLTGTSKFRCAELPNSRPISPTFKGRFQRRLGTSWPSRK